MLTTLPIPVTLEQIRLGHYEAREFAPALWEIPAEFRRPENAWSQVASQLMWMGAGAVVRADPRPGIDRARALLHIGAVLHAITLTVEHREAAAAYLLDSWFITVVATDNIAAGLGIAPPQTSSSLLPV